ncbi:MAG TPA: hypothetical protein VGL91_11140 [Acidobacteriota bacterium]
MIRLIRDTPGYAGRDIIRRDLIRLIISGFILALMMSGCGLCGEELKGEVTSPDGEYIAALFERGCGATTPFITHVNVRRRNDSFRDDTYGRIEQGEVFIIATRADVRLNWKSSRKLEITCVNCPSVPTHSEQKWQDLAIAIGYTK